MKQIPYYLSTFITAALILTVCLVLTNVITAAGSSPTPSQTQSPPSEDHVFPAQAASTAKDTAYIAIWSGNRVRTYMEENPGLPLIFENKHIRLEIPSNDGTFSSLTADDFLHVEIKPLSDTTIQLVINLNGHPVVHLPFTVTMPWDMEDALPYLHVLNQEGTVTGTAEYMKNEAGITFHIYETGIYTIRETLDSTPPPTYIPNPSGSSGNRIAQMIKTLAQGGAPANATLTVSPHFPEIPLAAASIITTGLSAVGGIRHLKISFSRKED